MNVPSAWPESLSSAFLEAFEARRRLVFRLQDGSSMRGYPVLSDSGPGVARVLFEGALSGVRPLGDVPASLEEACKVKGQTVTLWSMERDEPVLWVMTQ